MRLIVFLGSGVSLASGLPGVPRVMEILGHDAFHVDESGRFRPGNARSVHGTDDKVAQIRSFLDLLGALDEEDRKKAEIVFRNTTTYEDLYGLCQEIGDWFSGQSDNAMTTSFLELVERRAGSIVAGDGHRERLLNICRLAHQSARFIQSVIAHSLLKDTPIGLDLLVDLAESPRVSQLDIVTLNHDTLVEHLLRRATIPFVDGFAEPDGDVRWYDESAYDAASRVRLFKLHGSIDWYQFTREGMAWPAILLSDDPATAKDGTGKALKLSVPNPSFLAGGHKEAWYQQGIYADLHYRFHELLRRSDRIVMSGYGWGDIGINNQLDRWLERSPGKRIILLHEAPETLLDRSKILAVSYGSIIRQRKLVPIKQWLSDTSLDDIAADLET